jgi:hypothetical protein
MSVYAQKYAAAAVALCLFGVSAVTLSSSDADAGFATSVGLVAIVDTDVSPEDLVKSFRLVDRSSGQVEWQVGDGDISLILPAGNVYMYLYELEADYWDYDVNHTWEVRLDATEAEDSVYIDAWYQYADEDTYDGNLTNRDCEGTICTEVFLGATSAYLWQ